MSYEGSGEISIIKSDYLSRHFFIEKVFYRKIFSNARNYLHLSPVDLSCFNIKVHHIALYSFLRYTDNNLSLSYFYIVFYVFWMFSSILSQIYHYTYKRSKMEPSNAEWTETRICSVSIQESCQSVKGGLPEEVVLLCQRYERSHQWRRTGSITSCLIKENQEAF